MEVWINKMHDLISLCRNYGIASRGVIHIGAHDGQEVPIYQSLGMSHILLVEANPKAFHRLNTHVSSYPNVITTNYAICNYNGFAQLRVTNSDASSSILPLKLHKDVYPEIKEDYQITVQARKLDTLLEELNLSLKNYNFLNIDIQGAELLALQGAVKLLRSLEAINTEVNFTELYEGCVLIDQMDEFLGSFGFQRTLTSIYHPTFGDAFYVKRK
jgi:FkbM family methyltransferase